MDKDELETSDLEWFASNPPELGQHKGKYVAIFGGEVIGAGDTMTEASTRAREKVKDCDPLIAYIDESNEMIFNIYHDIR